METLFAMRLTASREKVNKTQKDLADYLNVDCETVKQWEDGKKTPGVEKLSKLSRMLGVSIEWLVTGEDGEKMSFYDNENLSDRLFDEEKMYTYVKTYATIKEMNQTLRVLPYARELHKNQYRKGKDKVPYIYHPLLLSCHALALGLDSDDIISTALLHDVCEDCGVKSSDLPAGEEVRTAVQLLTKEKNKKEFNYEEYYSKIMKNKIAIIVKLIDRCNNVSGMAAGFSKKKMAEYIEETEKWIYPLFRKARTIYPEYSNAVFLIKYHMTSVVESLKRQL